jgi:hypothetical protein
MTKQRQQLNGRKGKILYWDSDKNKFYVALQTRKSNKTENVYVEPGNLESPTQASKKPKKRWNEAFAVRLSVGILEIEKATVDWLWRHTSDANYTYLDKWATKRTKAEEREQQEKEDEARRFDEARKQAKERREREEAEWRERKAEFAQRRKEYEEFKKQQRRAGRRSRNFEEDFERLFGSFFMGSGFGGGGFYFFMGDDEDFDYDDYFEHQHEEDEAEKVQEAADILGVPVDASLSEVRKAYHRKARMYHPDSYRPEDHEDGLTKEEAQEHFKHIVNAYEILIGRFEDE